MKINRNFILFLYLFILALFVIKYGVVIDNMFGGLDDCFICTKVHFNGYLTNWSVSHFIAFLIAGYISPKSVYYIIFAGISWELIELFFEYNSKTNLEHFLCKKNIIECPKQISTREFWNHYLGIKESDSTFMWGSGGLLGALLDIVVNTLGVYTGIYIHKLVHK
jgi:hypothetical protein